MADSKESRKQELRDRVVDSSNPNPRSRARQEGSSRSLYIVIAILAILILVSLGSMYIRRELHSVSDSWSINYTNDGAIGSELEDFYPYADGMLRVTRDGASYINSSGKTVWDQAFEMTNPYASVNGAYAVIVDKENNSLYIMNTQGSTGRSETSLPITKAVISEQGVVYAILEDSDASYISVFSKEGQALDITIKSIITGDGYPQDLSVSPDGTELIVAYSYIENGVVQNRVVFYNLSSVGQSIGSNRVVGGFTEEFSGHFVGRVHFSTNERAEVFHDGGIVCFSTRVLTSPELISNITIEEDIRSIAYDGEYMAVITDVSDEELMEPYRLTLYRTNGNKVYDILFSFQYSGFLLDDGRALIYHNDDLLIYGRNGRLRFQGELNNDISALKIVADNPLGINIISGGEGYIECLHLR